MRAVSDNIAPDTSELIINPTDKFAVESYIFEPSASEAALGRFFAVAETEADGEVGRELIDLALQAAQKEYYREAGRGVLASFESALHQANLVLHDAAQSGLKSWMGNWHAALGVLAPTSESNSQSLHVSSAGDGTVFLVRRAKVTEISQDLSHSPITNPLRTFSQVASGSLTAGDALYFGTSAVKDIYRPEDFSLFTREANANTISTRLQQLYEDQQVTKPLGTIVINLMARNVAVTKPVNTPKPLPASSRQRDLAGPLKPRQPLIIHKTVLRSLFALIGKSATVTWRWLKERALPLLIRGSKKSSRAVAKASTVTSRNMQALTKIKPPKISTKTILSWPVLVIQSIISWLFNMPKTTKIFASVTLLLAVALGVSVLLLQQKRTSDAQIERASEILNDAQTKQAAAETSLIYDNRDQAHQLLEEARQGSAALAAMNLYQEEQQALDASISDLADKLQRVVRSSAADTSVIGDFAEQFSDATPTKINVIDETIYTYNPGTNGIVSMSADGQTQAISTTTEGIGFFEQALPHEADRSIVLVTDTPGLAIFDAKDNSLSAQDVQFASAEADINAGATFGSRLYLYDSFASQIFSFSKSLSGYGLATPWITDENFTANNIVSLAVDGSIFTLHSDGKINELFKGVPTDFSAEVVEPSLAGATKLITTEEISKIYVFDPSNKRVVIFDKNGELIEQMILDVATKLLDIAVSPDETKLYALDGTRVLAVPLANEE